MPSEGDLLYRHKWMALCRGINDEPFVRVFGEGVYVVPLNARGEVLFTLEPAVYTGRPVLGLPAGTVENGEEPLFTANRELQEEIGFEAGRLDVLSKLHPSGRHADWCIHAVLARDLIPSARAGDEPYEIRVEAVPMGAFEMLIEEGRLLDSSCIAALYLARRFLHAE